jgi:phosphoserine phosphatase
MVKELATVTLEEKDLSKLIGLINKHYGLKIPLQTMA